MNLPKEDLAYMAGLIDGEGSLCIFRGITKTPARFRFHIRLMVYNTHLGVMFWMQERFGGHVVMVKRLRPQWRQSYMWCTSHVVAVNVIKAVRPYMIIKAEQAEVFLAFAETMTHVNARGIPPELNYLRSLFAAELKRLNCGEIKSDAVAFERSKTIHKESNYIKVG